MVLIPLVFIIFPSFDTHGFSLSLRNGYSDPMPTTLTNSLPENVMPPGPVFGPAERVSVVLPLPLAGGYDYRVPDAMTLRPGDVVRVPLGRRLSIGVVWGVGAGDFDAAKLKTVAEKLPAPPMTAAMRDFVDWVARYTVHSAGAVLKMALSVPDALEEPTTVQAYTAPDAVPDSLRLTDARKKVLDEATKGPPRTAAQLARDAGVTASVVKGLAEAGALTAVTLQNTPTFRHPDPDSPGPILGDAQATAAAELVAKTQARTFSATLLDGVPGSGKTEVYFEAVSEALKQGRQVLVLLPEIALGSQWRNRFRERFGGDPVEWHSDLTQAQRRTQWRAIADGEVRVVVGARSALFLPFADLGLIVVDEEHDAAFKQEDGVTYNARDMAVVRASLTKIPVVLASATPSLESVANVGLGRYQGQHLPDRHGGASLPDMMVADMRRDPPPRGRWLSPVLEKAVRETIEAGEQAMLFLNRRGYAPLTLCRKCGYRLQCPQCTAWLVEHRLGRGGGKLQCHHCGFSSGLPHECPECHAEDSFAACGPGVERLAEEAHEIFPDARIAIAVSDTLTSPGAAAEMVRRIEDHEVDLLVGTQIVAKGYHFPMLTLVGVVDADLGLNGGDLRAAERTYQTLYQVAGRAGRAERPGRVVLQTYMPEHPVMQALLSGERDAFVAAEQAARQDAGMPPYGRLAALIVSGDAESVVDQAAHLLGRAAPRGDGIQVLGPAPAPFALLRGRHRRRLLVKTSKDINVQALLRDWMARCAVPRTVRVQIDVDPYSFQ